MTIFADSAQSLTVYTIKGQLVMKNAAIEEAAMKLRPGIYIINGKKIAIKWYNDYQPILSKKGVPIGIGTPFLDI